jgi:hypothetical protein
VYRGLKFSPITGTGSATEVEPTFSYCPKCSCSYGLHDDATAPSSRIHKSPDTTFKLPNKLKQSVSPEETAAVSCLASADRGGYISVFLQFRRLQMARYGSIMPQCLALPEEAGKPNCSKPVADTIPCPPGCAVWQSNRGRQPLEVCSLYPFDIFGICGTWIRSGHGHKSCE